MLFGYGFSRIGTDVIVRMSQPHHKPLRMPVRKTNRHPQGETVSAVMSALYGLYVCVAGFIDEACAWDIGCRPILAQFDVCPVDVTGMLCQ